MRRILVVAAHPDDEVLGCGGSVARHIDEGDHVAIRIVAEGVTSRQATRNAPALSAELDALREISRKACAELGVSDVDFLGFPDNRMDGLELLDVVKPIERIVDEFEPDCIYTHHHSDLNVDHQVVTRAVLTALRPLPHVRKHEIWSFEVPSATGWGMTEASSAFHPVMYHALRGSTLRRDYLAVKLRALKIYEGEMRPFPHARSYKALEALAVWRGSSVGLEAAEAFSPLRVLR